MSNESMCSTSADTVRSLHFPTAPIDSSSTGALMSASSDSMPPSPRLSPTHSDSLELDSDSGSVSSFPSISSSFFFSSAAASPGPHPEAPLDPHHHHQNEATTTEARWPHGHSRLSSNDPDAEDGDHPVDHHGLIIPSLTLPEALRRPTAFGQTLGKLKLIVIGDNCREIVDELLHFADNPDVVHVDPWEDVEAENESEPFLDGWRREASTDWVEHEHVDGEEDRFDPIRNVEIVALRTLDEQTIHSLRAKVHLPFQKLTSLINPAAEPSTNLAKFIATPGSPLYTALVLTSPYSELCTSTASPSAEPAAENNNVPPSWLEPLTSLSHSLPIIPLLSSQGRKIRKRQRQENRYDRSGRFGASAIVARRIKWSSFDPPSITALQSGLFRSPEIVDVLRMEGALAFLRWREVERAVNVILRPPLSASDAEEEYRATDEKMKVLMREEGWEEELSAEVAKRLRMNASMSMSMSMSTLLAPRPPPPSGSKPPSTIRDRARRSTPAAPSASPFITRGLSTSSPSRSPPRRTSSSTSHHSNHNQNNACISIPIALSPHSSAYPMGSNSMMFSQGMTTSFDPLHLPSLLMFSISLLGPLRRRMWEKIGCGWVWAPRTRRGPRDDELHHQSEKERRVVEHEEHEEDVGRGRVLSAGRLWVGIGIGIGVGLGLIVRWAPWWVKV